MNNISKYTVGALTLAILISAGYTIYKDDTHFCRSQELGMECERLSSTEKTCYPTSLTTIGKKYCLSGWEIINPVEPFVSCDYIEKIKVIINTECINVSVENKSEKIGYTIYEECTYTKINKTYVECVPDTEKILFKGDILEPKSINAICTVNLTNIICDARKGGDGNGDGICQSGETCYNYKLTDKIEEPIIKNGEKIIKWTMNK